MLRISRRCKFVKNDAGAPSGGAYETLLREKCNALLRCCVKLYIIYSLFSLFYCNVIKKVVYTVPLI